MQEIEERQLTPFQTFLQDQRKTSKRISSYVGPAQSVLCKTQTVYAF